MIYTCIWFKKFEHVSLDLQVFKYIYFWWKYGKNAIKMGSNSALKDFKIIKMYLKVELPPIFSVHVYVSMAILV